MSIHDVVRTMLKQAEAFNFDQIERHGVADVCRTAYSEFVARHPRALEDDLESPVLSAAELHAEAVARQYMREEIDKWHRRGYRNQADGVSHE